jgi:hypothetical protein
VSAGIERRHPVPLANTDVVGCNDRARLQIDKIADNLSCRWDSGSGLRFDLEHESWLTAPTSPFSAACWPVPD